MGEQILIVENNRMLLEMMKLKLENKGYHVKRAENGLEALNTIERNKIDLIISDIMMPNVSGLSLMRMLNENNHGKIPVIVMSSDEQKSTIASAKRLGAYDYIIKPVDFEDLCKKISFLLLKNNNSKNKNKPQLK